MDKANYRKELTSKTIAVVAAGLEQMTDDQFFALLNKGGELVIKSGTTPNGQMCDVIAKWAAGSADFNFVADCTFEARGPAGSQKLSSAQLDKVLSMVN
jgi:hypothetical protein